MSFYKKELIESIEEEDLRYYGDAGILASIPEFELGGKTISGLDLVKGLIYCYSGNQLYVPSVNTMNTVLKRFAEAHKTVPTKLLASGIGITNLKMQRVKKESIPINQINIFE